MPTTVLYFDHTASLGGGEIALRNLVQHLDRERYCPIVVLGSDGPLAGQLQELGIETHVLPMASDVVQTRKDTLSGSSLLRLGAIARSVGYALRLKRFMQKHRVDLVHTNSLKADLIGGMAARLARVPVIWHVRDRIADDYLPPFATVAFRLLCRVVPNFIIANSGATLRTLQLPRLNQAAIIYSGGVTLRAQVVHDGAMENVDGDAQHSRYTTIGLVGRISPWKGQHIFIEAASMVREQFPDARFKIIGSVMFGEEEYEAQIQAQVKALGLEESVEFTGFRLDIAAEVQRLDILVHASTIGEPFGQVVIDGMVASKPVVATNGGGIPEIVQDGETGLLVPMGDAPSMAEAIRYLLLSPQAAQAMGAAGLKRVQEHFTIELTARRAESVYARVKQQRVPNLVLPTLAALTLVGSVLFVPFFMLLLLLHAYS